MKMAKSLSLYIGIIVLLATSCIDRNMPLKYDYHFSVVDSNGINLVGDTINRKKYYLDSIKCYSADGNNILADDFPPRRYLSGNSLVGYIFGVSITTNSKQNFILKYSESSIEKDTIMVNYGKNNVNVYRNNQLILNKEDISQTTEIHFKIIK